MSQRLTMSRGDLAARCLHAWAESAPVWPSEPPTVYTAKGTATHSAIVSGDADAACNEERITAPTVRREVERMAGLAREWLVSEYDLESYRAHVEVAYALDPRTEDVKLLGYNIGRRYGTHAPHVVTGTADLVLYPRSGNRVELVDWKTGKMRGAARDSMQLRALATCAAAKHPTGESAARGLWQVRARLVYLAGPTAEVDSVELDENDFAAERMHLRNAWAAIQWDPAPVPGWWCRGAFCPIRKLCKEAQ